MDLTPDERLKVHLLLHYPSIRMQDITLSKIPGFLQSTISHAVIDIRGASYDWQSHPLRLWNELHDYFSHHVDVIKRKNGQPTLILWNGMTFHLDQTRTYTKDRRLPRKRERKHDELAGNN